MRKKVLQDHFSTKTYTLVERLIVQLSINVSKSVIKLSTVEKNGNTAYRSMLKIIRHLQVFNFFYFSIRIARELQKFSHQTITIERKILGK